VINQQSQASAQQYQQTQQKGNSNSQVIQAPVSINLNITGADTSNMGTFAQDIKTQVNKQIQDAFSQLGKQLVQTSRKV
jgi:hypothetical protein